VAWRGVTRRGLLTAPQGCRRDGRDRFLSRGRVDRPVSAGGGGLVFDGGKGVWVRRTTSAQVSVIAARCRAVPCRAVDEVRVIRQGVKPDGRLALLMPSEDNKRLSDKALGPLIVHLQRLLPWPPIALTTELHAMHAHLQTPPARSRGQR
jgi:hypothetical protein